MDHFYIFSELSNNMDIYDRYYDDRSFLFTVFKRELMDFINVLWFENDSFPSGISHNT